MAEVGKSGVVGVADVGSEKVLVHRENRMKRMAFDGVAG